jgi:hypothetical protein
MMSRLTTAVSVSITYTLSLLLLTCQSQAEESKPSESELKTPTDLDQAASFSTQAAALEILDPTKPTVQDRFAPELLAQPEHEPVKSVEQPVVQRDTVQSSPQLSLATSAQFSDLSSPEPDMEGNLVSPDLRIAQTTKDGVPTLQPEPVTPAQPLLQPQVLQNQRIVRYAPGITIFTPSGYGKSWGSGAVGIGFQSRTRFTDNPDGSVGISFGFGNARKVVGLDVGASLLDLSGFSRGALSFKVHRLLPADFAIAAGVTGIPLGSGFDGLTVSPFGVITKRIVINKNEATPFSQMFLSLGAGGGNFRSESNIANGTGTAGIFGSVAVRVIRPMTFIAEWSGQDLSLGLSVIPFKNLPLVITPAVTDITGQAGDGVRFVLGVGYGFSY